MRQFVFTRSSTRNKSVPNYRPIPFPGEFGTRIFEKFFPMKNFVTPYSTNDGAL